jgi:hypothetical protein
MSQDRELEFKVIERFIVKEKQERFKSFINKLTSRKKFTDKLAHFNDLDMTLFSEVNGNERQIIKEKIKPLNRITDCYIISENENIDGSRMNIDKALDQTIGTGFGTLLVFGDVDFVYYEGEGPNDRWISKKEN